jgi:hypothetical protein
VALVDAEEAAVAASKLAMVDRLTRMLMLARGRRLQVSKPATLRSPLCLPVNYLLRWGMERPLKIDVLGWFLVLLYTASLLAPSSDRRR